MSADAGTVLLDVGPRIRGARRVLGRDRTQEWLAEQSGLSVSYISMIERGERTPTLETLAALAPALGTTVAGLLAEPDVGGNPLTQGLEAIIRTRGLTVSDVARLEQVARLMFPDDVQEAPHG